MLSLYRPFAVEASESLGSYDGRGVTINRSASLSREVNVHESVHERIFMATLDGLLHRIILHKAEAEDGSNFQERFCELLVETTLAHEVCATYLGVQALDDPDERAEVFCKFPEEYAIYYKRMNDVIGSLDSGTYLNYVMGWSLAFWSFQSMRLFEVMRRGWNDFDGIIQSVPSPSERFDIAAELLCDRAGEWLAYGVGEATKEMTQRGEIIWDFHDDEEWRLRDVNTQGRAEYNLSASLCSWLTDHAKTPTASAFTTPEGFDGWLSAEFDGKLGDGPIITRDFAYHFDPANERVIAEDDAAQAAFALIENSDRQSLVRLPTSTEDDQKKVFQRLTRTVPASYLFGSTGPVAGKSWVVNTYTAASSRDSNVGVGARSDSFIVNHKFGKRLVRSVQESQQRSFIERPLFVYPVDADTIEDVMEDLSELWARSEIDGSVSERSMTQGFPLWYWTGDWLKLHAIPGIATASLNLGLLGSEMKEGYSLHVAKVAGVAGYFVRLHSMIPGSRIEHYEQLLQRDGELSRLPDAVAEDLAEKSAALLGIVVEHWYAF